VPTKGIKLKGPRCPEPECSSRVDMSLSKLKSLDGSPSCQVVFCGACGHILNTFPLVTKARAR